MVEGDGRPAPGQGLPALSLPPAEAHLPWAPCTASLPHMGREWPSWDLNPDLLTDAHILPLTPLSFPSGDFLKEWLKGWHSNLPFGPADWERLRKAGFFRSVSLCHPALLRPPRDAGPLLLTVLFVSRQPRLGKLWKLKPFYLVRAFQGNETLWFAPRKTSCDNVLSLPCWCVHSELPCEGGRCRTRQAFDGKCGHFYRPDHWRARG